MRRVGDGAAGSVFALGEVRLVGVERAGLGGWAVLQGLGGAAVIAGEALLGLFAHGENGKTYLLVGLCWASLGFRGKRCMRCSAVSSGRAGLKVGWLSMI